MRSVSKLSAGSTIIAAWSTVEFLGTVIQESCGAAKGFWLGFPALHISTCLWNREGSLILRCQGGRRSQVQSTDALIIQMTPCCQSVLAIMLAKAGVLVGFTYYWIFQINSSLQSL